MRLTIRPALIVAGLLALATVAACSSPAASPAPLARGDL